MEAEWAYTLLRYGWVETVHLFATYPVLWGGAVIVLLAAWKAVELMVWLLARTVRIVAAAIAAGGLAALWFYLRGPS